MFKTLFRWKDMSHSGHDFTPSSENKSVKLKRNAIYGKNALAFTCPLVTKNLHLHDLMTIFFVLKPNSVEVVLMINYEMVIVS